MAVKTKEEIKDLWKIVTEIGYIPDDFTPSEELPVASFSDPYVVTRLYKSAAYGFLAACTEAVTKEEVRELQKELLDDILSGMEGGHFGAAEKSLTKFGVISGDGDYLRGHSLYKIYLVSSIMKDSIPKAAYGKESVDLCTLREEVLFLSMLSAEILTDADPPMSGGKKILTKIVDWYREDEAGGDPVQLAMVNSAYQQIDRVFEN